MSDGLHCLGCDEHVGVDYSSLLTAGGGLLQSGVDVYEQQDKEKKASAAEQKRLADAIAADAAASAAVARAAVSSASKAPSASIDATAAMQAIAKQDKAGAGLSSDSQEKRATAAEKQLDQVTGQAQAKPTDPYLQALVKAWTQTVNKAHAGAISGDDGTSPKKDKSGGSGESWLTRKVVGPIPGYGVVVGGVGLAGAVGIVLTKVFSK